MARWFQFLTRVLRLSWGNDAESNFTLAGQSQNGGNGDGDVRGMVGR